MCIPLSRRFAKEKSRNPLAGRRGVFSCLDFSVNNVITREIILSTKGNVLGGVAGSNIISLIYYRYGLAGRGAGPKQLLHIFSPF